ncbi:linear amide C-N hydrolase, choloylglycine hydrolase family protein [Bifidobacterium dentium ATCC 27679]|uniref:choloylglycine hydrolase n=3 Tax=Bifidobacterium dentium TaxID=1689 RepID=E0Q6H0_9BIFI|nr:linear amide C-N hydrolase, choloylglycine hydrolase family protein [Bifidobacterium dentium ATCC 27679]
MTSKWKESIMCTGVRFSDAEGNMYFGRNLDWSFSYGETILVTPRAYKYDYVFGAEAKAEPNAVIGVGVVMADKPMYFDCANENGLAIAGLNFPGYASFAHEPIDGTINVATFEFPLWMARNFNTVDEVEEALKNVTLVSQIVPGQQESLLHWFIGDGTRSIVIEQMADGMHIHHDNVDVLTNQPTFDFHMENLRNYMCAGNEMAEPTTWGKAELTAWGAGVSMHGIPGDVSSPSRFVRVAYTNTHYPQQADEQSNVSRLFHTLGSVQMVDGCAKMANGKFERTLFTSGYSAKTKTYYMNTYDDPAIRSYAMADFDMDSSELITAE